PIVSSVVIRATDPIASVSGDTGTFTVSRASGTNSSLDVYYRIDGTASNGVDYALISNSVTLPAGARSNSITITPINHGQTDVQTVLLRLLPPPMGTPAGYRIADPSNAVVYIKGNGITNLPPLVRITSPAGGSVFTAPLDLPILARAQDLD